MASCTIPTCRRPLRPDEAHHTACYRCARRIRAFLREITLQHPLLQASLQPDAGPAQGSIHGGRAHAPLPVRGDVLTLLGPGAGGAVADPYGDQDGPLPMDRLLQGWAEMTADHVRLRADTPEPGSHEATGPRATPALRPGRTWPTWLAAYLPWALTAPWIAVFYAELAELVDAIRRITYTQPRRRHLDAPCVCGAFGLVQVDWEPYIECGICGRLYTQTEYRDHAARVLPPLYRIAVLMTAAKETTDDDAA